MAASLLATAALSCSGGGSNGSRAVPAAAHAVINEVFTGEPDFIEVFNPTPVPIDLSGWTVDLFDDGSLVGTYTFPTAPKLQPGSVTLLREGTGVDSPPNLFYMDLDLPWVATFPLEVVVRNQSTVLIDYLAVNTGGLTPNLTGLETFTGEIVQASGEEDVFRFGPGDTDDASDFRIGPAPGTPGLPNPGQGGTVFVGTPGLPDGYIDSLTGLGLLYSFTLEAEGGTPPWTWKVVQGMLPTGFTLNPGTGAIVGTPVAEGSETFTIRVTDSYQSPRSGFRNLSIQVLRVPIGLATGILINEAGTEEDGFVEILNPLGSGGVIDLGGWTVRFINDPGAVLDFVIPQSTLIGEGEMLVVRDGFGVEGKGLVFTEFDSPWGTPGRGACALFESTGQAVDYLNWNGPFAPQQPPGVNWIGTVVAPGVGEALWRNSLIDTDTPTDWSRAPGGSGSPGFMNPGQ